MKIVSLPIKSCMDCPHHKESNPFSTDGWDRMVDWFCTASNDKKIAGGVEWHEEKKITIPEWCPLEDKK
ncbi:hypothetical protein UFOVP1290_214 [uncultured Caudovirales phage]|uniref:Uncharacterized protein n=1 Tax=uncultured Caudovirales phage TaxID=2100421 RepID=A0A6J5RXF6_9CAUD|nr:hypothetical protein UFOVP1290_214 [uncultured Caudovirales phage]